MISDALENALFSALIGLFFSGIAFYFGRNRVKNAILGMINVYILDFIAKTKEHPEIMAQILKPIIDNLIHQYKGSEKGNLPLGALTEGGIEMLIPMLPRKWQGIAAIGSIFLNRRKKDSESSSQSSNPWG